LTNNLSGQSRINPMKNADHTTKKPKAVERISISETMKEKLKSLTNQANESLEGITVLTKSDVINYLLKDHSGEFSNKELQDIRLIHFNELKFSQWMTSQLKTAQVRGEAMSLKELINRNLRLLESPNHKLRKTRTHPKLERKESSDNGASPNPIGDKVLGQKGDPVIEI
jgi:hypothetical protein